MSDDKALSGSGVSVGEDISARIQRVMRKMVAEQDKRDLDLRKEADRAQYTGGVEEIWVFVKPHVQPDGSTLYSAETVSKLVDIGAHVRVDRYERTPKRALTELRFKLAKLWQIRNLSPSPAYARERAAKVEFRQALITNAGDEVAE